MISDIDEVQDLHWLMHMLQSLDVGLLVIDRGYHARVWNTFMVNHSARSADEVLGHNIFEIFDDIPQDWFRRKTDAVFMLNTRSFTTWEQRPYLFRFKSYRPITGAADFMYQNITFIPLQSTNGEINHIGIIIYDVTDAAVGKLALEASNLQLQKLSRIDQLTKLYNRGYWEDSLQREFRRLRRVDLPCSLVMFDIDHFKKVNDTYGHPTGDEVIRITADTLTSTIRTTDIAGRYGGEEFGVVLIDTDAKGALTVTERLRKRIEALEVHHDGHDVKYTVSLGIAEYCRDIENHERWIDRADKALYSAKKGGRNRSVVFVSKD